MKTATIKKEGIPAEVVIQAYSKLVNLEGEQSFIALCVKRMKANTSSVRDIQASIDKAGGNAPTIRKSHVQYFLTMQEILDTKEGAKTFPILDLIKLAQRLQTAVGKVEVSAKIAEAKNITDLATSTPTLATTRTRKNARKPAEPFSIETIITKAVSDIKAIKTPMTDLKTTDLQALATLAEMLIVVRNNTQKATAKK